MHYQTDIAIGTSTSKTYSCQLNDIILSYCWRRVGYKVLESLVMLANLILSHQTTSTIPSESPSISKLHLTVYWRELCSTKASHSYAVKLKNRWFNGLRLGDTPKTYLDFALSLKLLYHNCSPSRVENTSTLNVLLPVPYYGVVGRCDQQTCK